jgi:hypothetical protein
MLFGRADADSRLLKFSFSPSQATQKVQRTIPIGHFSGAHSTVLIFSCQGDAEAPEGVTSGRRPIRATRHCVHQMGLCRLLCVYLALARRNGPTGLPPNCRFQAWEPWSCPWAIKRICHHAARRKCLDEQFPFGVGMTLNTFRDEPFDKRFQPPDGSDFSSRVAAMALGTPNDTRPSAVAPLPLERGEINK